MFFSDPRRRWPEFSDPVARKFAARLPELMGVHDRRAGQPFLLGPEGRPDAWVNGFFTTYPMAVRDRDTWRKYAYALGLWLNFLVVRERVGSRRCPPTWRRSSSGGWRIRRTLGGLRPGR